MDVRRATQEDAPGGLKPAAPGCAAHGGRRVVACVCLAACLMLVPTGCASGDHAASSGVAEAWQRGADSEHDDSGAAATPGAVSRRSTPAETATPAPAAPATRRGGNDPFAPIATVNGRAISRHRVVDLLLRSHGPGVLEQLIVLDEAERLAASRGLQVSAADVDREYVRALRKLVDPLGIGTADKFDRTEAERILEVVLADRNISGEEFSQGMRRHAILRRIVESEQAFSEAQLREEFARGFGPRLQVRHIQLATPREASQVLDRLTAGDAFGELAKRYSANTVSAPQGGLLEPFSEADDALPPLFRTTSASLSVGEVSDAIRLGEWYHVIRLERRLAADGVEFEAVREEVTASLHERLSDPAMRALYERLFRQAKIEVHDPVLRAAFERVHDKSAE